MAKKKVCVSFDYEHDNQYYHLMKAWDRNHYSEFSFNDCTPTEIQTASVDVVKQVLSRKIHEANYMVAIIGDHSNERHPDSNEIGYRNWQAYEIAKNHEYGNGLVVVKLGMTNTPPAETRNIGAKFVTGFEPEKIVKALDELAGN